MHTKSTCLAVFQSALKYVKWWHYEFLRKHNFLAVFLFLFPFIISPSGCFSTYFLSSDNFFIFQGEKIQTILKAANVEVEPYWPGLFAKALEGVNIKELITNIGSGVGAAPAAGAAAAPAAAAAAAPVQEEKKKEEEPEESDDDMGLGLFD